MRWIFSQGGFSQPGLHASLRASPLVGPKAARTEAISKVNPDMRFIHPWSGKRPRDACPLRQNRLLVRSLSSNRSAALLRPWTEGSLHQSHRSTGMGSAASAGSSNMVATASSIVPGRIRMGLASRAQGVGAYSVKLLSCHFEAGIRELGQIGTGYRCEGGNLRCGPTGLRALAARPAWIGAKYGDWRCQATCGACVTHGGANRPEQDWTHCQLSHRQPKDLASNQR